MIKDIFKEMLDLQDKLNSNINKNWRDESSDDYDWASCVMVEGSESLDSIQYKHWKKQDEDIENFKIEIIDMFHFIMSQHIVKYSKSYLSGLYAEVYEETYINRDMLEILGLNKYLKREVKELVKSSLMYDLDELGDNLDNMINQMIHFNVIADLLGWDIDDIKDKYIVKNVLNQVRQDRGYKEGTYIKMWIGDDKKLYEDNVIAFEMIKTLKVPSDSTIYDTLYSSLIKYYDDMVEYIALEEQKQALKQL